jgi:hypothetical protein
MKRALLLIVAVIGVCLDSSAQARAEDAAELLTQLHLEKDQTPEQAEANRQIIKRLITLGPDGVEQLVDCLAENGDPRAQVALHTMVFTLGTPGREKELAWLVDSLSKQLRRDVPQGTKFFLIEQLQLTLGHEAVPVIAEQLDKKALTGPVARALTQIGGEEAIAALREALPDSTGRRRLSIMQALAALGDRDSLDEFRETAKDKNRDSRILAIFCLADLGDAASIDLVLASTDANSRYERMQNFRAALRLGERLHERGDPRESKHVYQEIVKKCTGEHDAHVKQAALRGLLELAGERK